MAGGRRTPSALNRPFEGLAGRLRRHPRQQAPASVPASGEGTSKAPDPIESDAELFADAMAGVDRLAPEARDRVGHRPRRVPRRVADEDGEALALLADLVAGESRFDVTDTAEYVEGSIAGLDPRVLRRLRRGEFAWQAFLDLHGMTAAEARPAVENLIRTSLGAGHRCVLIVHGRGRNSKDQTPVLKRRVLGWLSRGAIGRRVLAFTSARPYDGGAGALYVLLRRDRRKRPLRVTEGTSE